MSALGALRVLARRDTESRTLPVMPHRSGSSAALVFEVRETIVHPVLAKPGNYLLVEIADGRAVVSVIRRTIADPALCGALAAHVATGALTPLEAGGAVRLAELACATDYVERPRAGANATGRPALDVTARRQREPAPARARRRIP